MMRLAAFAVISALAGAGAGAGVTAALAEEKPIELKPGSSLDRVEVNCGACHSLDYIQMNAPFLSASGWEAEVTKMIKAYGAPINDADAKIIADYLTKNYGM